MHALFSIRFLYFLQKCQNFAFYWFNFGKSGSNQKNRLTSTRKGTDLLVRAYNIRENKNIAIARPIFVRGPGLLINMVFSSLKIFSACAMWEGVVKLTDSWNRLQNLLSLYLTNKLKTTNTSSTHQQRTKDSLLSLWLFGYLWSVRFLSGRRIVLLSLTFTSWEFFILFIW